MIEDNRYYWSHLKTKTVTVRVVPSKAPVGIVFRVAHMIDLGHGRQTITLEHLDYLCAPYHRQKHGTMSVPLCMGNFDFIYTAHVRPKMRNVSHLLSTLYEEGTVEKIVEDVLAPGDLLVFKQNGATIKIMETLRIVARNSYNKSDVKSHCL